MNYIGDIRLGDTFDVKFTSRTFSTGAPGTLSGTPVISAYPSNSTTQLTAGITLTVDFDAVTGLNNVRVVASSGNGYATATNYSLVITTGTVGGVSVVGEVIGTFSIEARSALMPTTAARTLDVASTGEAGLDFGNVTFPVGAIPSLGWLDNGTSQGGGSGTTFVARAALSLADTIPVGATICIYGGTGAGQARLITAFVGATDTATIDPAWTTNPDNTSLYFIVQTAAATGAADPWATTIPGAYGAGTAGHRLGNVPDLVAGAAGGLFIAGSNAATTVNITGNLTGNLTGSVGSVTGLTAANLDVAISTRMATYTQPTGFLAATFPTGTVANTTNITAGTITTATNVTIVNGIATGAVDADALATDAVNEIADGLLDRDMSTGTDSGSPSVRTVRQALRASRNKVSIAAGTLTVTKEDDATASWTGAVTTTAGNPISAVDPA